MTVCLEGFATMFGTDLDRPLRPVMLLGYADCAHASRCARYFRRLGWEVHMVPGGLDARHTAERVSPHVIVLDVDTADGWQTGRGFDAHPRVVLLAADVAASSRQRAEAVGALAVVRRDDAPEALVDLIYGQRLAEAV